MPRIGGLVKIGLLVMGGVVFGYVWRSYFPLALPFESPLVSDASSDDMAAEQLRELARAANERAEKESREREAIAARLKELENDRRAVEQNLGDLQIKTILQGTEN